MNPINTIKQAFLNLGFVKTYSRRHRAYREFKAKGGKLSYREFARMQKLCHSSYSLDEAHSPA